MRVTWLAWYICGLCMLIALLTSAITFHPDIQYLVLVIPAVFGGGAVLAGGAAIMLGQLPATHRIHNSKLFRVAALAVAVTVTLLLVLVG